MRGLTSWAAGNMKISFAVLSLLTLLGLLANMVTRMSPAPHTCVRGADAAATAANAAFSLRNVFSDAFADPGCQ